MEFPKDRSAEPLSQPLAQQDRELTPWERARTSEARLRAVQASGLLDSVQEPGFDSLTAVTARLLKCAASFISVVDGERDFYKSQHGFPEALAQARQMQGQTFCHFTLDRDEALVIHDTHSRPEWKAVPTVQSLGVRAYVGVPLKSGGENIGSFCVIDTVPRDWTADELETIRQLAASAARELDLRAALAAARQAAATARAQALSRERVLAVVAHDLRAPLQVIQLSAKLLQRSGGVGAPHETVTHRMLSAVGMMTAMVDSLLKSTDAPPHLQPVAASTLAADAVDMMTPMADKFSMSLVQETLPDATLQVDYGQLVRVLGNLIGNSLKYSPAGSTIRVAGNRRGDTIDITVTDNGVGMTDEEMARAFEPGWQSESAKARQDGVGLGLGIVKSLVEANQGQVRLESRPGMGTSVTISLPCS